MKNAIRIYAATSALLIILKLAGVIGWSWWLVLALEWVPALAMLLGLAGLAWLAVSAGHTDQREWSWTWDREE